MGLRIIEMNLRSKIFDRQKMTQVASTLNTRLAKKFKTRQVSKQINSPKTGRIYARGAGAGFRRFHRASARGEYPAPDTMNLVNSLKDSKVSEVRHVVFQDDTQAHYGKYLVRPRLDRRILPEGDVKAFAQTESQEDLAWAGSQLASA